VAGHGLEKESEDYGGTPAKARGNRWCIRDGLCRGTRWGQGGGGWEVVSTAARATGRADKCGAGEPAKGTSGGWWGVGPTAAGKRVTTRHKSIRGKGGQPQTVVAAAGPASEGGSRPPGPPAERASPGGRPAAGRPKRGKRTGPAPPSRTAGRGGDGGLSFVVVTVTLEYAGAALGPGGKNRPGGLNGAVVDWLARAMPWGALGPGEGWGGR